MRNGGHVSDDQRDGGFILNLEPLDADRPANYFNQLASSFTDVTMRIANAVGERFDLLAAHPEAGAAIARTTPPE